MIRIAADGVQSGVAHSFFARVSRGIREHGEPKC